MRHILGGFALVAIFIATGCDGCNKGNAPADAGAVVDATKAAVIPTEYPPHPPVVPLAERFCDAVQALPARRVAECCGNPVTSLLGTDCTRLLSASITDGVVKVDEAKLASCASAMEASLAGCDWVTPSTPPLPAACKGLIQGQLAEKSPCRSTLDCKASLHCADGFCRAPEPVNAVCGRGVDQLGTSTRQTDETDHPACATHCSLVSHRCVPVPEAGAQCFSNTGCGPGQLCIDAKCTQAVAGKLNEPCAGTTCAEGLRCVAKTCVPLATTGETCERDFDCAKGGCATQSGGGRTCGKTCSHAGDLDAIKKIMNETPAAPASAR